MDIHIGRGTEVAVLVTVTAATFVATKKVLKRLLTLPSQPPM
jgi:hypothetical protein